METIPLSYMMYACQSSISTDKIIVMEYDSTCDYQQLILDAAGILIYPSRTSTIEAILNDKRLDDFNVPVAILNFEDGFSLVQQSTSTTMVQFTSMMIKTKTGGKASEFVYIIFFSTIYIFKTNFKSFSTWGPDPEVQKRFYARFYLNISIATL